MEDLEKTRYKQQKRHVSEWIRTISKYHPTVLNPNALSARPQSLRMSLQYSLPAVMREKNYNLYVPV